MAAAVFPARPGTTAAVASPLAAAPSPSVRGHGGHLSRARLRASLRACTAEGLVAEVINACAGGAILTGWAIHLNASALLTGLVVALPQMAQLFQIPAAWTTAWLGHRRACIWLVALSRQALLPLALLPFLPVGDTAKQALLVAAAGVAAVLGVLGNNAWVAWMGELVPARVRGRYFGRRTGLCMLGGSLASAGAGLLLDAARAGGATGVALAALQTLACLAGVLTTLLMMRQHDPFPLAHVTSLRVAQVLAPFRDPAVRGLLGYQLAWNAAVGAAGSFFALHMIQNLRMGFVMIAVHGAVLSGARMLSAPIWGRLIDRFGARPVLVTCSFGIAVIPFLWLAPTPLRLWPLAFDAIAAGVLWCGQGLAIFALPLAVTPRRGRPMYLAAISAVGGAAFCLSTVLGGLAAQALPDRVTVLGSEIADLQVLFVVSGLLRLGAAFCSLRVREPASKGVDVLLAAASARLGRRPVAGSARASVGNS